MKKPANNSALDIRNELLKKYFRYTEADIKDYNSQYPNGFRITNNDEKAWASYDQVRM